VQDATVLVLGEAMKRIHRRVVLCLSLVACLGLAGQAQEEPRQRHVGRVQDWSYHHVTLSGGLAVADLNRAKSEPRMFYRLVERNLAAADARRFRRGGRDPRRPITPRSHGLKADWSIPLGNGIVAPNMFPAKYSFDINATPSCTSDYVVFGLNVAGATPGQANLVGVTNLYSGSNPRLCGANPTVNWAYNGSTAGGAVLTSPVISLDGLRIAYVESAAATTVFHVLTWRAGQGTAATTAVTPTLNGACTGTVANPTSSCLKSVTLSATASDTLSSPWIDYQTDKAFVGTNDGKIYRISCVFNCALNSNPTVDWTYTLPVAGTGGATAQPNGPVYDYPSGRLFVGDQLGELWVINASGGSPTLNAGPVMIGGGGCTTTNPPGRTGTPAPCTASGGSYGITDSIIMDSSGASQRIFAFSGNDGTAGASAVVAQTRMDLTGLVRNHIGLGSVGNATTNVDIHNGAFDNNYFGATPSAGELFVCGTGPGDTNPYHYWIGFTNYPVMNSTPTGSIARNPTAAGLACAPFTEIYNPNINLGGGHHDLLISGLMGAGTNGQIITNDISSGSIAVGLSSVSYPGGVSGIIVDNVSTSGQASSVYFSTQGVVSVGNCNNARCAVKLTQLSLQ
jgi:hypothetical protein